jgi:hypothetical protein
MDKSPKDHNSWRLERFQAQSLADIRGIGRKSIHQVADLRLFVQQETGLGRPRAVELVVLDVRAVEDESGDLGDLIVGELRTRRRKVEEEPDNARFGEAG